MIDFPSAIFEGGFVCDEVRKEDNGKLIAIGMYTGGILIDFLPVELGICLGMRIFPKQAQVNFHLRAQMDGERFMEVQAGLETIELRSTFITTPRFGVPVKKLGMLVFELSEDGQEWQELFRVPVEPSPAFTGVSPP